jgi:RNase P/RNase MRP subunit p29
MLVMTSYYQCKVRVDIKYEYVGDFMGDIVIEESNYKALVLALANLFLLLAFISIFVYGVIEHRKLLWLPSIFISLIFLINFISALLKASKVKPLLIITRDGIIDNSSHGMIGFISYNDIKEFKITKYHNIEVIEVILKDREKFIEKLPATKRMQIKGNALLKKPLIQIKTDKAKDMEPEDIYTLLQKRLMDYRSLYD